MPTFYVNIPSQIDNDLNPSTTQGASKTAINTGLTTVQNAAASDATTKANSALASANSYTDTGLAGKQPLDGDLTAIAGLSPSNDDVIQRKAGAWVNRSIAQLWADLKSSADALYVSLTGSYANPSWITSLAWSKITGTPTTLVGYGITDRSFAMQSASSAVNPADGATHSFADANIATATTYLTTIRLYVPKACTLKRAVVFARCGSGAGTSETGSFYVVQNGVTDIAVTNSMVWDQVAASFSNHSLNTAFAQDDWLNFKIAYPTWVTNPTGVTYTVTLYFE